MGDSGTAGHGQGSTAHGAATIDGADAAMAPAEVARWVLGQMFGGGEGEVRRIAADLAALGERTDALGREINSALGRLNWHGPASDAFVQHGRGRAREVFGVADDLCGLSRSVQRLVDAH
ncbi:hypothetical protein [Streptacidiphilus cavernicola]|uniref:WXG100 family type VII secretion target n=1 Tax=Streptacidiphilus cavernicola TaxID=3342716 RepID=A0ABV6VWZ9_9ACTN